MDWWGPGRPVFFDPRGGTHFEGGWQAPPGLAEMAQGGAEGVGLVPAGQADRPTPVGEAAGSAMAGAGPETPKAFQMRAFKTSRTKRG